MAAISFLIDQNPDYQGYIAMKTLLEFLILQGKAKVENYMRVEYSHKRDHRPATHSIF